MVNSKIPPEYWILLALKNASERHGLSLLSWYYSGIPDELIISYGQFVELLDEMEKNGFIKNASRLAENYCLTDEGKKEATRLKKRFKINDYYLLFSTFPEMELKERIEIFENIIISSFVLFFILIFTTKIPSLNISDLNIILILISVLIFIYVFAAFYLSFNFSKMLIFRIMGIQRDTWWIYKEWLWNNNNKITYLVTFLVVIILLLFIYSMGDVKLEEIKSSLAASTIFAIIFGHKKIYKIINSKYEKYFKPS